MSDAEWEDDWNSAWDVWTDDDDDNFVVDDVDIARCEECLAPMDDYDVTYCNDCEGRYDLS